MSDHQFLGPYRIGEPLGRGGMGSVFRAVHEKTGERVAVKLIAQHVADEARFRRRFDAEVKTLQRLRHRGIVRLIGFGEQRGQLFYSMELVEGEALQKRIGREKKLDWRPTLDIAIQICSALKHAHDIGVIHRDLKPANLLLTHDDTVKLVDFGIAKIFGDGEQTVAGSVLGTADYMAPEQASSEGITARTDLYALGSVMYAMLTGRPPFTGKKITDVIESLKRDRPVPLDLVNPDLPEALVELIHELLEKDPKDRPPTALAVMNRLKAMRAGLQREQTVVADNLPTEAGIPSNASDTSIIEDKSSSAVTGLSDQRGTSNVRRRTIVSKGAGGEVSKVSPHDATAVFSDAKTMMPDGRVIEDSDPHAQQSKTHFQTVDADGPSKSLFHGEPATTDNHWVHLFSIAAMIAVLLGCGWWFLNATCPPSADQAYVTILETDDLQVMEDFLRRFQDDPRYQEVLDLRMATKLSRTLKRLNTQAKLGVTPLDAFQQGFIDAMEDRQQNPKRASERIGLWLDIHDHSASQLDPVEQEMIELAIHEMKQLVKRAPAIILDPKAKELIKRIHQSVEQGSGEETRKLLEGILSLYADDEWARPAREEAERQLRRINDASKN